MGILLVCIHIGERTIVQAADGVCYEKLLSEIHSQWPELVSRTIGFQYTIGRHSNCLLRSEKDFGNMLGRLVLIV